MNSLQNSIPQDLTKVLTLSPAILNRGLRDYRVVWKCFLGKVLPASCETNFPENAFMSNLIQLPFNTIGVIVYLLMCCPEEIEQFYGIRKPLEP
jgi:hypothetical protein